MYFLNYRTFNNCHIFFWQSKAKKIIVHYSFFPLLWYIVSCNILAPLLICFRMTKGHVTFFRKEKNVASFLHLMGLYYKITINHILKCQFSGASLLYIKQLFFYLIKFVYKVYKRTLNKPSAKSIHSQSHIRNLLYDLMEKLWMVAYHIL